MKCVKVEHHLCVLRNVESSQCRVFRGVMRNTERCEMFETEKLKNDCVDVRKSAAFDVLVPVVFVCVCVCRGKKEKERETYVGSLFDPTTRSNSSCAFFCTSGCLIKDRSATRCSLRI